MSYRAPVPEMLFTLRHVAGLEAVDPDDAEAILGEAARIAAGVIAPLNRIGDRHGTPFADGRVTTPPGWRSSCGRLPGAATSPSTSATTCRVHSSPKTAGHMSGNCWRSTATPSDCLTTNGRRQTRCGCATALRWPTA